MIKVGIVGYGNLGKAVERDILTSRSFQLIKIFSRRNPNLLQSPFSIEFESLDKLQNYSNEIDLLFLCGGSFSDIEGIGLKAIKNFCTVDAFDTHSKLHQYKEKLDFFAKANNNVGLTAFGWDPGILSQVRTIFAGIAGENNVFTFWGKGVSQGHSDALRQLGGVENAIQFTIPNKKEISKLLSQPNYCPKNNDLHHRVCFVSLNETQKNDKNFNKNCKNLNKNDENFNEIDINNEQIIIKSNQKDDKKYQNNSIKMAKNIAKIDKKLSKKGKKEAILLQKTLIKKQIQELPNYFAGQKTTIHFVNKNKVLKLQRNMKHKGTVISHFMLTDSRWAKMKFEIEMNDNPSLTARMMTVAGKIAMKLFEEKKFGGYSILDIPPKYFLNNDDSLL